MDSVHHKMIDRKLLVLEEVLLQPVEAALESLRQRAWARRKRGKQPATASCKRCFSCFSVLFKVSIVNSFIMLRLIFYCQLTFNLAAVRKPNGLLNQKSILRYS